MTQNPKRSLAYGILPVGSVIILSLLLSAYALGHGTAGSPDASNSRTIDFPDTDRFLTLVVDPHTHSVFSDGHVWPSIRVEEALRDGLDAIAITEHLEYQPHLADIPHPDRNRAYQQAVEAAGEHELIVIAGSEITRKDPIGHINAIFIEDANKLLRFGDPEDSSDTQANTIQATQWPAQEAVENADTQDAFVFWNHPWFSEQKPDGMPVLKEFHTHNIKQGLIHGIEIANGEYYSEEAFQIGLDNDLTLIGVSDIHELIDWQYKPHEGGHRPVTLVFAKEKTPDAIKKALFDQRTVVWYRNLLIGREKYLTPLLQASLTLESAEYIADWEVVRVLLSNHSDANFQLLNTTAYTFGRQSDLVEVPAHESLELIVKGTEMSNKLELKFDVLNALSAPKHHPSIKFRARLDVLKKEEQPGF